jgi:F0F1-type ATP synthase membrane subunit c/vacuolar-type H+-ATPase subunit K
MTAVEERSTFEERLLPMLVEAIPKGRNEVQRGSLRKRRTRRSAVLLVAAIVGVAVAGSILVPAVGERGVVRVYAQDALRDPEAVERTLRTEGGIDAQIIEVPVSDPPREEAPAWWWWLYWDGPVDLSPSEFALLQAWVGLENGSVGSGGSAMMASSRSHEAPMRT